MGGGVGLHFAFGVSDGWRYKEYLRVDIWSRRYNSRLQRASRQAYIPFVYGWLGTIFSIYIFFIYKVYILINILEDVQSAFLGG